MAQQEQPAAAAAAAAASPKKQQEPPAAAAEHSDGPRDRPWTDTPISWDQAKAWIEEGTVESLGLLRRSKEQLTTYRAAMDEVREQYASVADYVKITVLERACRINPDTGKKEAVDMEHGPGQQLIWHLNDFPYYFEAGVQHWLLWAPRALPRPDIDAAAAERFGADASGFLVFVNPAALQSITSIWHCHVLVRPKQPAAA